MRFVGMIVDIRVKLTVKESRWRMSHFSRCVWNDGCCRVSVYACRSLSTPSKHDGSSRRSCEKGRKGQWQLQLNRMYPMSFADKLEDSAKILENCDSPRETYPEVYAEITTVTKYKQRHC